MSELMTAAQAREIVNAMEDKTSKELKERASSAIQTAVEHGSSSVSLNIPYTHREKMKAWFTGLGYKVSAGSDQRDGDWFTVSW